MNMLEKIEEKRRAVTEALRKLQISGPEERYNLEYLTASELAELTGVACKFTGTHYWFNSPVLDENFLRGIVSPDKKILDVGAGNGTLLRKLIKLGIAREQLTGVDISGKAVERIRETGARAFHGTVSAVTDSGYGTVFLSYFVDRDSDQRGTFERTTELLTPSGVVVLEGLFPCVLSDSNGVSYGTANVTKGNDALEDIQLVVTDFVRLGITLQKVVVGQRLVYSLDGPEVLPFYILIFKKN